jgi:hypothetical protein
MDNHFLGWIAPGMGTTEKHLQGKHDQLSHGSWAGGSYETSEVSPDTAGGLSYSPQSWDDKKMAISSKEVHALIADARANGGFTYKPTKGYPKNGFAVAVYPEHERILKIDQMNKKQAEKAFKSYYKDVVAKALAKDPGAHWGAWYDTDNKVLVFDMSRVVKDKTEGVRLGREYKQKAIWDIENMSEIALNADEGRISEGAKERKEQMEPKKMIRLEFDRDTDPDAAFETLLEVIESDLAEESPSEESETDEKE